MSWCSSSERDANRLPKAVKLEISPLAVEDLIADCMELLLPLVSFVYSWVWFELTFHRARLQRN